MRQQFIYSINCDNLDVCLILIPTTILIIFFFFNDTATTEIYTLSLHDALPISSIYALDLGAPGSFTLTGNAIVSTSGKVRSEEHTSELQSHLNLVCRLLLEKKNKLYRMPDMSHHNESHNDHWTLHTATRNHKID